jgi:hypothetical protein
MKRQKVSESKADEHAAQRKFLYQHRLLQEGVEGAPVEDESKWVKCELCKKWRPMPIGTSPKVIPQLAWMLMSTLASWFVVGLYCLPRGACLCFC